MAEEAATGSELPTYNVVVTGTGLLEISAEAARLALVEAKKGRDVLNYSAAVALLRSLSDDKDIEKLIDPSWVTEQEKKNAADAKRMENELKQYKNNLIRESIRMGNEDLGIHYHQTGDLQSALKAFSRMRDFCTAPEHIASNALRLIAVSIEQRNWLAVQTQVHKIRTLSRGGDSERSQARTATALGLHYMALGDYREAATSFLSTDPSLGDGYNEVITCNDVAVYGGLCALASMSRSELQAQVLENANFRNFLELEPHIRRAIAYFCASKYSQCLEILESYRVDYLLDIYLQSQVESIYHQVRTKSIVQYFQPFSKVTLSSMETMFGNPVSAATTTISTVPQSDQPSQSTVSSEFLYELTTLIQSEQLDARIDLETMTLVAKTPNLRAETQKKALDTVDRFMHEARIKLLRMGVMNAGLEIRPQMKSKGQNIAGGMDLAGMMSDGNGPIGIGMGMGNFQGQGYSLRHAK